MPPRRTGTVDIKRRNIDEIDTNGSELLAVVFESGAVQRHRGKASATSCACENSSSIRAGKADNFVDVECFIGGLDDPHPLCHIR